MSCSGPYGAGGPSSISARGAPAMTRDMRRAKLVELVELEGFEEEVALFAAVISDSIMPGDLL